MSDAKRDQETGRALARKGKLAIAAALVSVLLAACGDGGDSSSATAPTGSAPPTGSVPPTGSAPATGSAPLAAVASAKGATTLSWQPPTMNDDGTPLKLKGYRIYWGLTEGNLSQSVTLDNPGLTRYVVEQLTPATWYFAATALSADGESEPSNVVAMKIL
jgi:fibronectin type III domain protein